MAEYVPPPPRLFLQENTSFDVREAQRYLSPSGDAELIQVFFEEKKSPAEEKKSPVVALVRKENFSNPVLFNGFTRGIFLGEHELILEKNGSIVFASDDGKLGPSFEASWPPYVRDGHDRVVLQGAQDLLFLDHHGKLFTRGILPENQRNSALRFVHNGGVLVELKDDGGEQLRLLGPEGRLVQALFGVHDWVLSEDGRVFAASTADDKKHTVTAYSAESGAPLGHVDLPLRMMVQPVLAIAPRGDHVVVGYGVDLHVLDTNKKSARRLPGYPPSNEHSLSELRITPDGEACLWSTDSTGRAGSCEAEYLVDLASGRRRPLGDREACLEHRERAERVKLPAPDAGRMRVISHYFGPGGICGLGISGDLRTVARLEAAKGKTETDVKIVVREVSSGKATLTLPFATPEGWRPSVGVELSQDGSRLVAWTLERLRLIDVQSGKVLAEQKFEEPPWFPENSSRIIGLFSGEIMFDREGKPIKTWPAEGVPVPSR